ncbi:MAG: DUF2207 domain-containing protein, partial [Chloroflexi bacterium]|nr:DUF2207 domain-containing protein [Chloroflexota bacterium]
MKRSLLFLFSLLLLLTLTINTADAQSSSKVYRFRRLDVDVAVQQNGNLDVVETQEYEYVQGTFSFGYRAIHTDKLDRITNIGVSDETRKYQASTTRSIPNTFVTFTNDDGDFEIRWFYPTISNSKHIFTVAYTVLAALRYYPDGDQVWWRAVFEKHFVTLGSSKVTVHLPNGIMPEQLKVASYGATARNQIANGQTVVFNATDIADGDYLEVRVQFPHGIVQGTKPRWQDAADRTQQVKDFANPIGGLLGVVVPLFGLLGVYVLWFVRGRDVPAKLAATYISDPPDETPPGVIGTLMDEHAEMRDIMATLVDLARRGYVNFVENESSGFMGIGAHKEFTFVRTGKDDSDLRPYERTLLAKIFMHRNERELSDLREKFYSAVPIIESQMYDEVVSSGFYRSNPQTTRRVWTGIGVGLVIIAAIVGFVVAVALSDYVDTAICPFLGLGLVGIALIIAGQAMPARTKAGAEAAAKWQAFRRYLVDIDKYIKAGQA